jgi:hypothetical protein
MCFSKVLQSQDHPAGTKIPVGCTKKSSINRAGALIGFHSLICLKQKTPEHNCNRGSGVGIEQDCLARDQRPLVLQRQ